MLSRSSRLLLLQLLLWLQSGLLLLVLLLLLVVLLVLLLALAVVLLLHLLPLLPRLQALVGGLVELRSASKAAWFTSGVRRAAGATAAAAAAANMSRPSMPWGGSCSLISQSASMCEALQGRGRPPKLR